MVGDAKTIRGRSERSRNDRFEHSGFMGARHRNGLPILPIEKQCNINGFRQEAANCNSLGISPDHWMGAKNREGIPVVTLDELFELIE